jgi:hypothetical protein
MSRKIPGKFLRFLLRQPPRAVRAASTLVRASFRHEGDYNGGDAAAGSPPCIGRENGRVGLISEVLPSGRLWYDEPSAINNAIGYASHYSRSHGAVIRVYDESGNVIETHEHAGDFKEP